MSCPIWCLGGIREKGGASGAMQRQRRKPHRMFRTWQGGIVMNRWTTGAVLLLVAALAACGNNNTKAGIVISAASATTGASSVTVPINGTEQFAASVTGVSVTTVNWQVCLP